MIMNRIVTSYPDDGPPRAQSTPARHFCEALEITAEIPRHLRSFEGLEVRRIIEA